MDLLITLVVLSLGFMLFGSLFYAVARVFTKRRNSVGDLHSEDQRRSVQLRINRSHNIYSFK